MDVQRAEEILEFSGKIDVQYQGEKVWIDSVDSRSKTAKVHYEEKPKNEKVVPVQELQEVQ